MKKITLSIGLIAAMLSSNAQDTVCTYFANKDVIEFDYQVDTILSTDIQKTKFYEIKLEYGDILCLGFLDEKNRVRKVIAEYFDGEKVEHLLESKDNLYYSQMGIVKVLVSRPRIKLFTK
tara:strand:+ start:1381 stop:1740 length:360 start_codon:yes stop_codon:yes gene_type:complete